MTAPTDPIEAVAEVLHDMACRDNPGHADWTGCTTSGPCYTEAAELTAAGVGFVAEAERERDEAQEHIARWLIDHPPLSTAERVERGSTGDLSVDMMRYASRLQDRAERAEAALAAEALRHAADDVEDECTRSRTACFCGSAGWLRDRADRIGGES